MSLTNFIAPESVDSVITSGFLCQLAVSTSKLPNLKHIGLEGSFDLGMLVAIGQQYGSCAPTGMETLTIGCREKYVCSLMMLLERSLTITSNRLPSFSHQSHSIHS